MPTLRQRVIRAAYTSPELRAALLPLLARTAGGWREIHEDDEHYYVLETPEGRYVYTPFRTWEGTEKPTGNVTWGPEHLFVAEGTLQSTMPDIERHRARMREKAREEEEEAKREKQEETLEDRLRSLIRQFRSSTTDMTANYRFLMQEAQRMGLIDERTRRALNKHNRQIGKLEQSDVPENERMAQGLEILLASLLRR